jgi:hypothetical protein
MRWARHVVRVEAWRGVYRVLVGTHEGKRPLRNPGVGGTVILRRMFRKWDVGAWTGLSWLRIGTCGGHYTCINEPLDYITCWEFLD